MQKQHDSIYEFNYTITIPKKIADYCESKTTKERLRKLVLIKNPQKKTVPATDFYRTIIMNTDRYLTDRVEFSRDFIRSYAKARNVVLDDRVYIQFLKYYLAYEEFTKCENENFFKETIRFRTTKENYKVFYDIYNTYGAVKASHYFSALVCYFYKLSIDEQNIILNYDTHKALLNSYNNKTIIILDNGRTQKKMCVYKQIVRGEHPLSTRKVLLLYDFESNKAVILSLNYLLRFFIFRYETARHDFLESETKELETLYKNETDLIECKIKINYDIQKIKERIPGFIYRQLNIDSNKTVTIRDTRRHISYILYQLDGNYEVLTPKYKNEFNNEIIASKYGYSGTLNVRSYV